MHAILTLAGDGPFWTAIAQLATLAGVVVSGVLSWLNRRALRQNNALASRTADLVNGHLTRAIDNLTRAGGATPEPPAPSRQSEALR